jgi:hypothetical protein
MSISVNGQGRRRRPWAQIATRRERLFLGGCPFDEVKPKMRSDGCASNSSRRRFDKPVSCVHDEPGVARGLS